MTTDSEFLLFCVYLTASKRTAGVFMSICACLPAEGMVNVLYVCLFLTSCSQMGTCRRWPSSMSTETCTKAFYMFTWFHYEHYSMNIYHHQTAWSNIIAAEIGHWWLRSVLFGRRETNKNGVMRALSTERVALLLWGTKLATDDLCQLF